jgi:hypothetical protein
MQDCWSAKSEKGKAQQIEDGGSAKHVPLQSNLI